MSFMYKGEGGGGGIGVCKFNISNLALLVIICKTLKKKGRAFRNIGYFTNMVVSVPLIRVAFFIKSFHYFIAD